MCVMGIDFASFYEGPSWSWSYGSYIYHYLCNQCLSPLTLWFRTLLMARCTGGDQVCQWLATDRWFSHGTPVSSTNKSYRHDITDILLKVALITITLAPLSTSFSLYFGPVSSKWYVLCSFYFSRRHFWCQKRAKTWSEKFYHSRGILPLDSTGARRTLWWLYSSCKI